MKRKFRILKNSEYQNLTKTSKFVKDKYFVVYFKKKKEEHARVGISVSKKIGIAVVRNKIKRQIKAILRENINFNTFPIDYLIYPRQQYQTNDFEKMKINLLKTLKKLGE